MENWKEIFASFGLWSLVEDISDDGDGEGDSLQLTKDGELFVSEITQELSKAKVDVISKVMLSNMDIEEVWEEKKRLSKLRQ
jgi:hypothetical protein